MTKFNVVVAKDLTVIAVSRLPLGHGTGIDARAYQVEADDRWTAKEMARTRRRNGDLSDEACWQS
jgi:hypothetical protein